MFPFPYAPNSSQNDLLHQFHILPDQEFGMILTANDILKMTYIPLISNNYWRLWRPESSAARDVGSTIKNVKDKFHIILDVHQFTPEEISVKTVDGFVVIEGKQEEKKDEHGFIMRHFTRRYALPEDCNPEHVVSRLSSDGVLSIIAPKQSSAAKAERVVNITPIGPVRKEVKEQTSQANPNGTEN